MVHFLRNSENRTIIEVEATKKDLSASVNISTYTQFLLELYKIDKDEALVFTSFINTLSEIRGTWWETIEGTGEFDTIDEFVAEEFKTTASRFNLEYVTD